MGFPNLNATEAFARPSLLSGEGNGLVMKGFGLRSGEPNMEKFQRRTLLWVGFVSPDPKKYESFCGGLAPHFATRRIGAWGNLWRIGGRTPHGSWCFEAGWVGRLERGMDRIYPLECFVRIPGIGAAGSGPGNGQLGPVRLALQLSGGQGAGQEERTSLDGCHPLYSLNGLP